MSDVLDIYLGQDKIGSIEQTEKGQLAFSYSEDWLASSSCIPISLSLPLQIQPFDDQTTRVWFANLLPEGRIRETIAKRYGVNARNEFSMLKSIGRDCAGAISIWPQGEYEARKFKQKLIDKSDLAKLITNRKLPLLIADNDEVRLSLAGAQEKLPLIYKKNEFYLAKGGAASTHILKPEIEDLESSVANEIFCMRLASECGLNTAKANIVRLNQRVKVALIERFDRIQEEDNVVRIHQEDFCQALGLPPEFKYQSEGGPDLLSCINAIRKWSTKPGKDVIAFIDWVIFNVFIGNCDSHAKNVSFIFAKNGPELAPFYDLISTIVYEGLSDKLSMDIGDENRISWLQQRHWERLADEIDVKPKLVFDRLRLMNGKIIKASEDVTNDMKAVAIVDKIVLHIKSVSKKVRDYR